MILYVYVHGLLASYLFQVNSKITSQRDVLPNQGSFKSRRRNRP